MKADAKRKYLHWTRLQNGCAAGRSVAAADRMPWHDSLLCVGSQKEFCPMPRLAVFIGSGRRELKIWLIWRSRAGGGHGRGAAPYPPRTWEVLMKKLIFVAAASLLAVAGAQAQTQPPVDPAAPPPADAQSMPTPAPSESATPAPSETMTDPSTQPPEATATPAPDATPTTAPDDSATKAKKKKHPPKH